MPSIKSSNYKRLYDLRVWGLDTTYLDHLIPKDVSSHKPKILAAIFKNKISFFNRITRRVKKITLHLGSVAYKIHLGDLGPENVSSNNSGTLAPTFTHITSFSTES